MLLSLKEKREEKAVEDSSLINIPILIIITINICLLRNVSQ